MTVFCPKQLIFLNILCEINFRAKAENYEVFPKIVKEKNQRIISKAKFAKSEQNHKRPLYKLL